jgi:hypothetical protein
MSKITVTAPDGTVSDISSEQYNAMIQQAVCAVLAAPEFEDKLGAIFGRLGDAVINRLGNVEQAVKDQGEKIVAIKERVKAQEEKVRENSDKTQAIADTVNKLRSDFEKADREKNRELAALRQKLVEKKSESPLDSCPDPGNLQAEFKQLLQVKRNNKNQLIFGPVFSKTPDDGFLDKDNLEPLDEEEIAEAIRATGTEGVFTVTVTNAGKRMAKVRFEGASAADCCKKVIASWRTLRDDYMMWAGPDQPVDLARMEANAKKFGIALRTDSKLASNSYVTVLDGVLFIGAIRIAPVYMIPEPARWPLASGVVLQEIKSFLSLPWTARKVRGPTVDMASKI